MLLLQKSCAATVVAAFFLGLPPSAVAEALPSPACTPTGDALALHDQFARTPAQASGQLLQLEIPLQANPAFSLIRTQDGRSTAAYSLFLADIAEGWSWQPQTDPAAADYYRYKAFPLGAREEVRASYAQEDKIGAAQQVSVRWRYDYFLAYDNPYAFTERQADAESAFRTELDVGPDAALRLIAVVVLDSATPPVRESSTFWKATHARPTDFTLKKRYLVGRLQALNWCDGNGRLLGQVLPRSVR